MVGNTSVSIANIPSEISYGRSWTPSRNKLIAWPDSGLSAESVNDNQHKKIAKALTGSAKAHLIYKLFFLLANFMFNVLEQNYV